MKKFHHPHSRGQSMVLMALMIILLCLMAALTVDYGMLVIRANQLQRACDSAALGAAWKYYNEFILESSNQNAAQENQAISEAKTEAVTVAAQNATTITTANVTFSGTVGSTTPKRVVVTASLGQSPFFARIIGSGNTTITRKATAEITPVVSLDPEGGVAPLAITVDDFRDHYNTGNPHTVTMERIQQAAFTDGEIIGMDIRPMNGKSPSKWEEEVTYGDTLNFISDNPSNTAINASRGNQSNRLQSAINTRIANGQTTLYIMLADPQPQNNGTTNIAPRGVAKIKINSISVSGSGNAALASFSFTIIGGGIIGDDDFPLNLDSADISDLNDTSDLTNSQNTDLPFKVRLIDDI